MSAIQIFCEIHFSLHVLIAIILNYFSNLFLIWMSWLLKRIWWCSEELVPLASFVQQLQTHTVHNMWMEEDVICERIIVFSHIWVMHWIIHKLFKKDSFIFKATLVYYPKYQWNVYFYFQCTHSIYFTGCVKQCCDKT